MNYFFIPFTVYYSLISPVVVGVMPSFSVWVRYLVDGSKRPVRCPFFTSSGLFSVCCEDRRKKGLRRATKDKKR